jgi:hypothetical protein
LCYTQVNLRAACVGSGARPLAWVAAQPWAVCLVWLLMSLTYTRYYTITLCVCQVVTSIFKNRNAPPYHPPNFLSTGDLPTTPPLVPDAKDPHPCECGPVFHRRANRLPPQRHRWARWMQKHPGCTPGCISAVPHRATNRAPSTLQLVDGPSISQSGGCANHSVASPQ